MYKIIDMDVIWMTYALILSDISNRSKDVTIGAVLVLHGNIIGYGYNSSILLNDPSAHAEIIALRMGGSILSNYRLINTTLYVTLEPCIMCVGAMIHARVHTLVCGARDSKIGWSNLWLKYILSHPMINHRMIIKTGVLERMCSIKISEFFKLRRLFI